MRITGLGVTAALFCGAAAAATPVAAETVMNAAELAHELDRLAGTVRVLYVAAHPDDENTRLLAWLANGRHVRAAYLSLTRGGGGQNLIGAEQGALLDVIRTEELLAARRIDGAEQRFTRVRDFGYTKSAAEALAIWGRDEALADVVWVVRTFQPDVILTRFDENPPNHGHHTASAILAREAFAAAADPKRFPEQLALGAAPWQAERLLHNWATWRETPVPADALEVDVGAYDPRHGLGFGELAAHSRSQHRSQGFGVAGQRGRLIERFVPLAGSRPQKDILEGIPPGWERFGAAAAPLTAALDEARRTLERDRPEAAIPALLRAHAAFDALPDAPRVRDGRRALERVLAAAAGLFVRATAPAPVGVPGTSVAVDVEVVLRRPAPVVVRRVVFPGAAPQIVDDALEVDRKASYSAAVAIAPDAPLGARPWLAAAATPGRHTLADPRLAGDAGPPPGPAVVLELRFGERPVTFEAPVVHASTDPVLGERVRRFLVVPPATLTPAREAVMLVNGRGGEVALRVRAGRDGLAGKVTLPVPEGWRVEPAAHDVALARAGDETNVVFRVTAPAGARPVAASPVFTADGRAWSWRETVVDYPHIPVQLVLQPASLRLAPLSIRLPEGTIGYVEGSGDSIAEDLAHVGARVETIDDATLQGGELGRFAAIVTGIRAYNTREALRRAHPRLMRYVEDGGTLVVQYNTNSRLAPMTASLGPYPIEIGRERITDERAAVTLLDPAAAALTRPNAIGAADFEGWEQERGIYFAAKWDERYRPLFAIADPGEEPVEGAALVARHGKGRYVYTGLAFFRQLPAGVPGAYRLFANLLARD